jgi:uroporphyrinogen-III synthase
VNGEPLARRRILVTRPEPEATAFARLISAAGGEALRAPVLEIRELADLGPFHAVADRLESFDLAIFVSRNAVRRALALLEQRGKAWPARLRAAAIGQGSRAELEAHGFAGVIAPTEGFDSEALLALPALASIAGKRIVIFRGESGRKFLGESLAARGAQVEHAPCYRRAAPEAGARLRAAWAGGPVDAVTVSSAEALANLARMLQEVGLPRLGDIPLFVPHARVAASAPAAGARRAIVAGPGDAEMLAALVAYFRDAG